MNNTGPRGGCLFPLGLMALILAAALGACAPIAQAQQPVLPGKQICSNASGSTVCSFQPVTDASPLPVSATASIAGFNQETVLTPFTATTSGVTSGSFTAGKVIVVTNAGTTNMAYCRLGASATTSGQPIAPNGGWFAFTTVAETQVTCATSTSTTTINVGVGTGLPTGTGGGGGGGGSGGGAVYGPTANGAAAANPPVVIGGTANGSGTGNVGNWKVDNSGTGYIDMVAGGNMATALATGVQTAGSAVSTSLVAWGINVGGNARQPTGVNPSGSVYALQVDLASVLGSTMSATNGIYSNLLQGNAVLSASNALFAKQTDGTNVVVTDPCQAATKLYKAFSQTATAVLVTGAASKKTYVCSISIIAGAAEIFNLTAGTGSTCGTNTVAVMGSTTAANGLSLAANGGLTFGSGLASLAATTVNQDDLCLQQSGSNRLSGSITYVQL